MTATDDALLVLRSQMPSAITRAQARHVAREVERLRAFEADVRGAAQLARVAEVIGPVIANFDRHYRDPHEADRG